MAASGRGNARNGNVVDGGTGDSHCRREDEFLAAPGGGEGDLQS
jgi:hypothetical protein